MPRNRTITLRSFRRFVKTTISHSAGSDYSEWIIGHKKSSYYTVKTETRAEIYANRCMKYLTFLDYSTLEATGRSNEARINELETEKQITEQKHTQEIRELREYTDHQLNKILMIVQKNPKLARLKGEVLINRPLKKK